MWFITICLDNKVIVYESPLINSFSLLHDAKLSLPQKYQPSFNVWGIYMEQLRSLSSLAHRTLSTPSEVRCTSPLLLMRTLRLDSKRLSTMLKVIQLIYGVKEVRLEPASNFLNFLNACVAGCLNTDHLHFLAPSQDPQCYIPTRTSQTSSICLLYLLRSAKLHFGLLTAVLSISDLLPILS